ncbi:hypothetical protein OHB41_46840 [Streptomyces sp. NBC_01571]|uniref:hypothetical protein n=1 Tax=Streptomyces sp. NBC_01571 TaxID=2975883 RepID=UPI00224C929B|nr:hypothetical protein [Streptomyces sp. NBC_01571]MCX4580542.1 hypothetical protein [Streptomyces sp. NBC_01571]
MPGSRSGRTRLVAGRWSRACCPPSAFEELAEEGYATNEGLPGDIPVEEGCRLLMLDEQMYQRSWNSDRCVPLSPGTAE